MLITSGIASAQVVTPPLNVVVILSDDQRFDSMWAMPITQAKLGANGVNFSEAVVTTPLCCPFRGSFLGGGYYAHNTRVLENALPNGGFTEFADDNTLPLQLQQDAGYSTFFVGKYMNSYFYRAIDTGPFYVPPGWSNWFGWSGGGPLDLGRIVMGTSGAISGTGTQLPGWVGHETDVFLAETLAYLNTPTIPAQQPRFIYFSTTMPHYPATPAPIDAALFPGYIYRERAYTETDLSDKPAYVLNRAAPYWFKFPDLASWDEYNRDQLRSLQVVDRAVGALYDWFDAAGQLSNTVFVFTSDNGFNWGEHGLHGKGLPYEESIRVPLIVAMSGISARTDDNLVAVDIDIPASILEWAGLPHSGDGTSLVPLLQNPATAWRQEIIVDQHGEEFAVVKQIDPGDGRMWKYVWYGRGRTEIELYDLTNDPFELESIHADPTHTARIASMHAYLEANIGLHVNAPVVPPNAHWGVPFFFQLNRIGGVPPYEWTIVDGALPAGLVLDASLGTISGTPTELANLKPVSIQLTSAAIATQHGGPQRHVWNMQIRVVGADMDSDGIHDSVDNCPDAPNGPWIGTCTDGPFVGLGCLDSSSCGVPAGFCSLEQEDGNLDTLGDACDPSVVPEPSFPIQVVIASALLAGAYSRRKRSRTASL